ncbi:hypothetical protein R5R35_009966 [Gryllus longicercus]|uniref:Uncharacterized protein n=1 Tax=Gryllus longicercus TaxID=2509291 RepID=A0AAN9Z145_9ORTH
MQEIAMKERQPGGAGREGRGEVRRGGRDAVKQSETGRNAPGRVMVMVMVMVMAWVGRGGAGGAGRGSAAAAVCCWTATPAARRAAGMPGTRHCEAKRPRKNMIVTFHVIVLQ